MSQFCAPLQQLMDEHISLREEMNSFYEVAEEIEYESGPVVVQLFKKLNMQIAAFTVHLKAHSLKEDKGLFPMMTIHLGDKDNTIEVMEFEHEKAEGHLQDFLTEANKAGASVNEEDARVITVYAVQAFATLIQHFAKEEKVLFPLAEELLSEDEKTELTRIFNA